MKPFRCLICVFFLILILSISVQAAPPMGIWTAPGDFENGNLGRNTLGRRGREKG